MAPSRHTWFIYATSQLLDGVRHRVWAVLEAFAKVHSGSIGRGEPNELDLGDSLWHGDPALLTSAKELCISLTTQETGVIRSLRPRVPFFYSGPYVSIDEGLMPQCPWAGGVAITASGVNFRIMTPGCPIDASPAIWQAVLLIPAVRKGRVPVVYDAEPPLDLIRQVSRSLPHGMAAGLLGRFGPRLALLHATLMAYLPGSNSVLTLDTSSHTSGYANGDADAHVAVAKLSNAKKWESPADARFLPGWAWPLRWKGLFSPCPVASPKYTLWNWEAAFPSTKLGQCWTPRDAGTERWALKACARRTWTHETATALNLRRLSESFRKRRLPFQFWRVQTEDGIDLPGTWSVWVPQARAMGVACGFGCGSCRDCEDHSYECVARRQLKRVRRELFLILSALGISAGVATALSHHPSVIDEIVRLRVPNLWAEVIPELVQGKRQTSVLWAAVDRALVKFLVRRKDCPNEQKRMEELDRWRDLESLHKHVL
eukprot:gene4145-4404_t